nr:MAG TPA: hypothetical protein [Bacteriophage sp.]
MLGLLAVKRANNIIRHSNLAGNTLNFTTYIYETLIKEGFIYLLLTLNLNYSIFK